MYYYRYKTHFKFWRVLIGGFFSSTFLFHSAGCIFNENAHMGCSIVAVGRAFLFLKFLRDWTVLLNFYLDST
jgi:hypothetical protein